MRILNENYMCYTLACSYINKVSKYEKVTVYNYVIAKLFITLHCKYNVTESYRYRVQICRILESN